MGGTSSYRLMQPPFLRGYTEVPPMPPITPNRLPEIAGGSRPTHQPYGVLCGWGFFGLKKGEAGLLNERLGRAPVSLRKSPRISGEQEPARPAENFMNFPEKYPPQPTEKIRAKFCKN